MSLRVPDTVVWLGLGVAIYAAVRGVSYGLHTIYDLTEVAPAPDSPRAVAQGTEDGRTTLPTDSNAPGNSATFPVDVTAQQDNPAIAADIPLPSLQMLAMQHPNLEIRKAAAAIITTRVLNDHESIRRVLADYRQSYGASDQRAARNALQLIRSMNGVDLEDMDDHGEDDHDEDEDDEDAAAEAGFDATDHAASRGGRSRSSADMRREMARSFWAVEHVREGDRWEESSDINSNASSSNGDLDDVHDDQDITITSITTLPPALQRALGFEARQASLQREVDADVAAVLADPNRPPTPPVEELVALYGDHNHNSNSAADIWGRHRFPENRRALGLREPFRRRRFVPGGEENQEWPEGGIAPWRTTSDNASSRTSRARSAESEEEVARRRVRREAVVVNDGDRPISQEDIIQRPLQRRSHYV